MTVSKMTTTGSFNWTPEAKYQRARIMYSRGQHFLLAAAFLKEQGRDGYATLYLLCQGLEVVLKAILLLRDYDKYKPKLRPIGHNLEALLEAVRVEFELSKCMSPLAMLELGYLNSLYSSSLHTLRYASFHDLMIDPGTIAHKRVESRLVALQRLVKRELANPPSPTD